MNLPLRPFQKGMIGIYCLIYSIFLWSIDFLTLNYFYLKNLFEFH